ncbi:MAG: TM2 domain-containing protein [Flavobacteriaceae bacterium]|nr:TM2 domain-containing protein [Flavobacteriaceae bacterium]
MKLKLILSLAVMLMSVSMSYASFPVERATTSNVSVEASVIDATPALVTPAATSTVAKQMSTALLLWFFLGAFAAHRWYLGSPVGWNILFILTLGGLGIWAIVDLVDIITEKYPGL